MNDELLNRARELLALRDKIPVSFGDVMMDPHAVADTIAALLAEVERLQSHLRALAEAEPVGWTIESGAAYASAIEKRNGMYPGCTIPLIRRPEAP